MLIDASSFWSNRRGYIVDDFGRHFDPFNAVLSGTTTIYLLALVYGPAALGSRISVVYTSDVADCRPSST